MLPTTASEATAFCTFSAATGFTAHVLWTRRETATLEAVGRHTVCILMDVCRARSPCADWDSGVGFGAQPNAQMIFISECYRLCDVREA